MAIYVKFNQFDTPVVNVWTIIIYAVDNKEIINATKNK